MSTIVLVWSIIFPASVESIAVDVWVREYENGESLFQTTQVSILLLTRLRLVSDLSLYKLNDGKRVHL